MRKRNAQGLLHQPWERCSFSSSSSCPLSAQSKARPEKLGEDWWKVCFHLMLAYNYLQSGRPADVLKECDVAWKIAQDSDDDLRWQRRTLYYKGRAFLAMNSIGDAQKAANDLKELVEKGANKKEMRLYHHLLGLIELEKKNYSKAIEHYQKFLKLWKDSDLGFAEVEDARKRLAELGK